MTMRRRDVLLAGTACLAGMPAARAAVPAPTGAVVLTLSGRLRQPNHGDQARFDMAALAALPQREIQPPLPWYETPRRFTGPLLRDVLAAAGASGNSLRATALNEYRVDIPVDDVARYDVVLARLLDGKPMPVRDKGPLFVLYPFDRHPELRTSVYFGRCIWQLRAIEVR